MTKPIQQKYQYSDLIFIPIDEYAGDLSSFASSDMCINNYLTLHAKKDAKNLYSMTYVALPKDKDKIVGFFTLKTDAISYRNIANHLPNVYSEYEHAYFPAVQISHFAVDENHTRRDVGRCMMTNIYLTVLALSKKIGMRFVILHSVPRAFGFYKKLSFRALPELDAEDNYIMYLDIMTLRSINPDFDTSRF